MYNYNYYDYLNNASSRNDYYNYNNNNYNHPTYTEDVDAKKIYDPYQGFIRGNMYPNLYNGYKINPVDIKPANEQANLLTYLDALCFATIDIQLYLDIYPEDKNMYDLYHKYVIDSHRLSDEYQEKYAPLFSYKAKFDDSFTWVKYMMKED